MLPPRDSRFQYDALIVAPNAAIDSYYLMDVMKPATVNRARAVIHTAGGKGNNMARAMKRLDGEPFVLGVVGGYAGQFIRIALAGEDIAADFLESETESRHCFTIIEKKRADSTVVLEPGAAVGAHLQEELRQRIDNYEHAAPYIVFTGSIPPDFTDDFFSSTVKRLTDRGHIVGVDTSGPKLLMALKAGAQIVKVNRLEFTESIPFPADEAIAPVEAHILAKFPALARYGLKILVITEGSQGALVITAGDCFRVVTTVTNLVSSAGAGDSFFAGLLLSLGRGLDLRQAARIASATAAANLQQVGCGFLLSEDIPAFLAHTRLETVVLPDGAAS